MAKVYCQDSSRLLQHTIDVHQGKNIPPLKSNDDKICPPMPNRGEVDFIFGGKIFLYHIIFYTNCIFTIQDLRVSHSAVRTTTK